MLGQYRNAGSRALTSGGIDGVSPRLYKETGEVVAILFGFPGFFLIGCF